MRYGMAGALALTLMTLPACAQEGRCSNTAAKALVGQATPTEDEALRATGATSARIVRPEDPVTMDYNPDRVTIVHENGKVVRALCG